MRGNGEITNLMAKEYLHGLMVESKTIYVRYDGNYVNDLKEGYGEYTWKDGREYKVMF